MPSPTYQQMNLSRQKLIDLVALALSILLILVGLEILFTGKSSVSSAGWHTRGQVITSRSAEKYTGWKRLTGVWISGIGCLIGYGAVRAIRRNF